MEVFHGAVSHNQVGLQTAGVMDDIDNHMYQLPSKFTHGKKVNIYLICYWCTAEVKGMICVNMSHIPAANTCMITMCGKQPEYT